MTYKNAADVLPKELVTEIQKHVDGCLLYIPTAESKFSWGEKNGTKQKYIERNKEICRLYEMNIPLEELSRKFYLSEDSIRKVVSQQKAARTRQKE